MIKANSPYFIVEIDKKEQLKRRSMAGSLYIPENFQDMKYNLQIGKVIDIGKNAHKEFPEVEIGDFLIFDHKVEFKPRMTNEVDYNDYHLLDTLDNHNELRIVSAEKEAFGVVKEDVGIIPHRNFIFCHENFEPASFQLSKSGLYLPQMWEESSERLTQRLEELKEYADSLQSSMPKLHRMNNDNYKKTEEIQKQIAALNTEREEISKKMNSESYLEVKAIYINPETNKILNANIEAGDKVFAHKFALYPLSIVGINYSLIRIKYAALLKKENHQHFSALQDFVLVEPDEKPKEINGLYIPDTAKIKVNTGKVYKIASNMGVSDNDSICFDPRAGTPAIINDETYLLMKEDDILYKAN